MKKCVQRITNPLIINMWTFWYFKWWARSLRPRTQIYLCKQVDLKFPFQICTVYSVITIKENHKFHTYSITPSEPAPACQAPEHLNPHTKSLTWVWLGDLDKTFTIQRQKILIISKPVIIDPSPHWLHTLILPICSFPLQPAKTKSSDLRSGLWLLLKKKRGQLCAPAWKSQKREVGKAGLEMLQAIL